MREALVKLRENAGLTRQELAHLLGVNERTVGRWETGERTPLMSQRSPLAKYLRVSLTLVNDALRGVDLAAPNGHLVRRTFRLFASLEQGAVALDTYQPVSLPGLIQTRRYATVVETAWPINASAEDVERRVESRLVRQRVLATVRLRALIDASVLHRDTGGAAVMAEQLDHLRRLAECPNIEIRVVPFDHRAHVAGQGSFTLFTGEEEDTPYAVATEDLRGPTHHEDPTMVMAYVALFSHLWSVSDEVAEVEL